MSSRNDEFARLYEIYQNGKMRRYNLLFAVNGGAFAILKFAVDSETPAGSATAAAAAPAAFDVLLAHLPWGLAIFSLVMFVDIWGFGQSMQRAVPVVPEHKVTPFTWVGKTILLIIASLLITGWLLLVLHQLPWPWPPPAIFAACAVFLLMAALVLDLVARLVRRLATSGRRPADEL